jgi:protein-tyrosine phosphatase
MLQVVASGVDLHNLILSESGFNCEGLLVFDLRKEPKGTVVCDLVALGHWSKDVDTFVELCERNAGGTARILFLSSSLEEALHVYETCPTVQTIRRRLPDTKVLVFGGEDADVPRFLFQSHSSPDWLPSVAIPTRIAERLFLGDVESGRNSQVLKCLDVTFVVDASCCSHAARHPGLEYLVLALPDHESFDLKDAFEKVAQFEHAAQLGRGVVLIHCERGISRSTSLLLYVLMANYKMSLRDAWLEVAPKRSIVRPNTGFVFQLIEVEMALFGQNSVRAPNRASMGQWGEVHLGDLLECDDEVAGNDDSADYGGVLD